MLKAILVGPRGESLGLTVELEFFANPADVGITTNDGRLFFYDRLMSTPEKHYYREYVELN